MQKRGLSQIGIFVIAAVIISAIFYSQVSKEKDGREGASPGGGGDGAGGGGGGGGGSGGDKKANETLGQGIKFAQLRFYLTWPDQDEKPEPIINGNSLAEITWAGKYRNAQFYTYVFLQGILGHFPANKDQSDYLFYYDRHRVYLDDAEIEAVFAGGQSISLDILQIEDIKKLYRTKYPAEQYKIGVELNSDSSIKLDSSNNPFKDDSTIDEYKEGKTLLLPVAIANNLYRGSLYWNFENHAVREYLVDYAKKHSEKYSTNNLALDNTLFGDTLSIAENIQYLKGATDEEKVLNYAKNDDEILRNLR